ncbi:MAG: transglycosylase SLT domain-containing protein [Acidimicrobiales bacterium]
MARRLLLLALVVAVIAGVAAERSIKPSPDRSGDAAVEAAVRLERVNRRPAFALPSTPSPVPEEQGDGASEPVPSEAVPVQVAPAEASPSVVDLAIAPVAGSDPAELTAQLLAAERGIRDPASTPEQLAHFGHLQQVAYRALVLHPDWDAAVSAALPEDLRPVMAANVGAGRELRRPVRVPQVTLPAWRIVEPAPAAELRAYYEEGEAAYGVPWQYLAAVNLTETRMGRIRGYSSAGARGPMQFIPGTWARYGEGDIDDPHDAIMAAARYLSANGGTRDDMSNALFRYNPVSWYVDAVSAYAEQMVADERAYLGYYSWQVYFVTDLGDVLLPVGYASAEPRPVTPADLG